MARKRLNVFHLIDSDGLYGAEHVLLNLLPQLEKRGIDILFGCMSTAWSPGGEIGLALLKKDISVVFIDEEKRFSLRGLNRIRNTIRANGIQILHAHGYKATILGGLVSLLLGIPLFATYHGESAGRDDIASYLRIETFFLRRAAEIIAVSSIIDRELIFRGVSPSRVTVISNGIEDPISNGGRTVTRSSGELRILCVGRLIRLKRFDLVIDAVHELRSEHPGVVLSIAGGGPLEDVLREQVQRLNMDGAVRFLGYVENTAEIYREADIFVLFSETEGAPVVLLEAMAYSLPIIATSVGAIPEIVENDRSAIVVPRNDLNRLVEKLGYLIANDEARRNLGEGARARFLTRYCSGAMASAYAAIYERHGG